MSTIYAAIEIGTSRTVLAVGSGEAGERLNVTCHAHIPSAGVVKSQIINVSQAAQSVKAVIRSARDSQHAKGTNLSIVNAFLVVSGQHVVCEPFQSVVSIAHGKVENDDIEQVSRKARTMALGRDRELVDVFEQTYSVDELAGIASPLGMSGSLLKLNTLQLHAPADRINDAYTAAGEAKLALREPLFAATCAAEAVLDENEKNLGSLVLDLGGGSTGYAVYSGGVVAAAGAIGIGGDHITNDIQTAFLCTRGQAEALKTTEASAILGRTGLGARITLDGTAPGGEARTISRKALDTVTNARCRELAAIVRATLEDLGLLHRLGTGIVLTGGGAYLEGMATLFERELGAAVRIGNPVNVNGLEDAEEPASFAAIAGALICAHRAYEEKSLWQSIKSTVKGFMK